MFKLNGIYYSPLGFVSEIISRLRESNHQVETQEDPLVTNSLNLEAKKFGKEFEYISKLNWKDQQERREYILRAYQRTHTEPELIEIFSRMYRDNNISKEIKNQTVLCLNKILSKQSNLDLHGFISDEKNNAFARRFAIVELINRNDKSAYLTFVYRVIVDTDDVDVRKMAAIGLGELGGKISEEVLEKVKESDPIYPVAQEALDKILGQERTIKDVNYSFRVKKSS